MNTVQCPVCTLYLREGITLKEHLDTHPKDKVIEALVSSSEQKVTAAVINQQASFQNTFIQQPFHINNHVANPVQFSIIQPNSDQMQAAPGVFVPNIISNRRYIVSQPGTLIKVPQRNPDKLFATLPAPYCNQLIGTTNYASPQLQIPNRTPTPHILSTNTQTINTQGGPAIIYSQLPPPVQSVQNVQQHTHFQSVQNFQVTPQPQEPLVVPSSTSLSTPISSSNSFCNSNLQTFNTTITPVQSTKTPPSMEISHRSSPVVEEVPISPEHFNVGTQVSSGAISNHENLPVICDEQYVKKLYEEVTKDDSHGSDHYAEYFDANGHYMTDAHCSSSNDETVSELKEEPEDLIEDDKSSIECFTEHQTSAIVHAEQDKDGEVRKSEKQCITNAFKDQNEDMILGDDIVHDGMDYHEDATSDIHEDIDERQDDEYFETQIDIDEKDITLENTIDNEQEKEMDLSKPSVNKVTSSSDEIHVNKSHAYHTHKESITLQSVESKVSAANQPNAHTNVVTCLSDMYSKKSSNTRLQNMNNQFKAAIDNIKKTNSSLTSMIQNKIKASMQAVDGGKRNHCDMQPMDLNNKIKLILSPPENVSTQSNSKVNVAVVSGESLKVSLSPAKYSSPERTHDLLCYKSKMLNRNVVIEPVDLHHGKDPGPSKNKVSISYVSPNNRKEILNHQPMKQDLGNKPNIIIIDRPASSSRCRSVEASQDQSGASVEPISVKHGPWSFAITADTDYKLSGVMYSLKSFGNKLVPVHRLEIPSIKTEEEVKVKSELKPVSTVGDLKPLPCSSSTPDVTVHLISKIKTEPVHVMKEQSSTNSSVNNSSGSTSVTLKVEDPALSSKPNPPPYSSAVQRGKKQVRVLQIKNAKKTVEPTPCNSVIQHPVKTEPPPPYDSKHGILPCQPSTSKPVPDVEILPAPNTSHGQNASLGHHSSTFHVHHNHLQPPTVDISPSKFFSALPSPRLHSPSLQDFTDLVNNTKLDRLTNLHAAEYDSVDTPHWLLRSINILPQVIEDDRISCASPKTLLNLDHQTSFQTFEPEDSGSTSINMQTDEMMPPRGELSGQESLESSVWGYQEDHVASQYRQWDDMEPELPTNFRTKIEPVEPMELLAEKIKVEEVLPVVPAAMSRASVATKKKHACIYCNKTFTGWKLRKYHMRTEHAELFNEPEPGKLLSKASTSQSGDQSEASTSFVSQCPIKFENSNSFSTEFLLPSVSTNKQRQCESCAEVFDKLKPWQDHVRNVHPLVCPVCSKTFLAKSNLTLHMRTHLKIKPYKCDVCEKSFVTAQKLSDHKNTHTGNAPFPCNMCDRHFKRYSNLAQHKKVIHLKKKKTKDFYCHCGEIFQSRGKLMWHQETHANIPKQCTYCSEKFTHTSSLTRHIRKNHDPCYLPVDRKKTDENVTCVICNIVVLKSTLKSHMRIHDTAKPFACTVCKKSFYTKWNLGLHQWTHVSRTHMPFKCKSCNRGFYSGNEYQAHLRSHRNIRPYTCNYCGRKFIRKFNCIRHVREHEAKKKYTCTVCGKTFHRSYYLTAHVRVHNGERPFSCHICGKTSTTKSNHNKHVKTHHARETVNTEG